MGECHRWSRGSELAPGRREEGVAKRHYERERGAGRDHDEGGQRPRAPGNVQTFVLNRSRTMFIAYKTLTTIINLCSPPLCKLPLVSQVVRQPGPPPVALTCTWAYWVCVIYTSPEIVRDPCLSFASRRSETNPPSVPSTPQPTRKYPSNLV